MVHRGPASAHPFLGVGHRAAMVGKDSVHGAPRWRCRVGKRAILNDRQGGGVKGLAAEMADGWIKAVAYSPSRPPSNPSETLLIKQKKRRGSEAGEKLLDDKGLKALRP